MQKLLQRFKTYMSKLTLAEHIIYSVVLVVFILQAAYNLYYFFFTFTTAFKTHDEIVIAPFALPEIWHWENFIEIFTYLEVNGTGYFGMVFNSLYFATLGPLITQLCTALIAYTACKYEFPGSRLFYPFILITMTLPLYGSGGSLYLVIKNMNLIDSYLHIVLAFSGLNASFLYYHALFKGVSDTYGEAAVIDGANDFTIYWKIMLPQAKGLFVALFVMGWLAEWNNYSGILIYLPNLPTLAGGMYLCHNDMMYDVRLDMVYAGYAVSAIPGLLLFAIFHETMTTSISIGGVKE